MRECPECGAKYADEVTSCANDGATLVDEGLDALVGQTVGSYVITKCLGKGGMGAVYQGEHPTIGSKVAIKFLHKRYASDKPIVDRFFNEARAVNVIGHDNIVKVTDFATAPDGSPYFVMEFLEGRALTALVGAPRELAEIGPIFLQVADGLQAAHDHGIIHRDLKPDNIFLVTRNRRANFVKIVDFGIAKLQNPLGPSSGKTQTGMVMGTAHYMSPEQAGGEVNRISAQSDIYSLGVIMFQLACGKLPFDGGSFGEILIGHLMRPPPSMRELVPDVPEDFEAVVQKCLAKKPEERFSSMTELYEALGEVLDAHGLSREPPLAKAGAHAGSQPNGKVPSRPPGSNPNAKVQSNPSAKVQSNPNAKRSTPPATPAPRSSPNAQPRSNPRLSQTLADTEMSVGATIAMADGRFPGERPNRTPLIAGIVSAVVVIGGLGAFLAFRSSPPPAPVPLAPAPKPVVAVPTPPAPAAEAEAKSVKLSLLSEPAAVKVTITQGEKTQTVTTPASVELARGEKATAHLEAEGYTTKDEELEATRDAEIRFVLTALPARTAEAHPHPAPTGTPEKKGDKKPEKKKNVGDGMMDVDL